LSWKENKNNFDETHNLSGVNNHYCENYSRKANKVQTSEPLRKSSRLKNLYLTDTMIFYGDI
jgi:hypothetical protein